jgi:hypothetical protein
MSGKRAWFQIHLSTAIALTFGAGGFLYLNWVPTYEENDNSQLDARLKLTSEYYGWPYQMMSILRYYGPEKFTIETDRSTIQVEHDGTLLYMRSVDKPSDPFGNLQTLPNFRPFKIDTPYWRNSERPACNLLVALGCLFFLAWLLEFFARRREGRRHE